MAERDKYGNYVNDKGVVIKITTDRNGKEHISFYGDDVDKKHDAVHVNVDYDKEKWDSTTHNADKSETEHSSGGCYLTTACMRYYLNSFDDNCYELSVLRWFRDNFVSKEDIEHYYHVAPIIVAEINKEEKSNIVYDYIYDNIVGACVEAIENGDYEFAYSRYKNSILALEQYYAKTILEPEVLKVFRKQITI